MNDIFTKQRQLHDCLYLKLYNVILESSRKNFCLQIPTCLIFQKSSFNNYKRGGIINRKPFFLYFCEKGVPSSWHTCIYHVTKTISLTSLKQNHKTKVDFSLCYCLLKYFQFSLVQWSLACYLHGQAAALLTIQQFSNIFYRVIPPVSTFQCRLTHLKNSEERNKLGKKSQLTSF